MKFIIHPLLVCITTLLPFALAAPSEQPPPAPENIPGWATRAIWYQVFIERFRNGDPSNDPTLHDMQGAWPHEKPAGWKITPWGWDWYRPEPWTKNEPGGFYRWVHHRRYGGDLQGLLDRLDYLQELGVTALYLNPVNDSPSLHKYDARNYRHADRNFGPDPRGDERIIDAEDPTDPATWSWTAADRLLLEVVDEAHRRDMRVILDYSWNHTGIAFWAWRDLVENQRDSPYAEWYAVDRFDDPTTPEDEFSYTGWAGVKELPAFAKFGVPEGYHGGPAEGDLHSGVKRHVFAVSRRWLDPDGDGDCSDGVDGFRLDVAEQVPLGFWRDYRRFVKSVNPEAFLLGEIWWEQWPLKMSDPGPWLPECFDAVMNYRWYAPARSFLNGAEPGVPASELARHLDSLDRGIPRRQAQALMNLAASHDSPRLATSLGNDNRYKYHANPRENRAYRIGPPDRRTREIQRLLLVLQFALPGSPQIWNGDEAGMWGADDPDNRKPLVWEDLEHDNERWGLAERSNVMHGVTSSQSAESWAVTPDAALLGFYRRLIMLRRENADLFSDGKREWLLADDQGRRLAFRLTRGNRAALVILSADDERSEIRLADVTGTWELMLSTGVDPWKSGTSIREQSTADDSSKRLVESVEDALILELEPRSALVMVRR